MANPQTDGHAREQTRRDDQAHKNAEAGRAGLEKLTDHRQRATADAWKSVEGSVDAASQSFRNGSDQFARNLGYSGEEGKRLARQSAQDVEAITKYGAVLAEAAQDSSRQWYGLAQRQWQRNFESLNQLARCRSVQDFVAVHSGLVRESLQHMAEDGRTIAEISLRGIKDASKAIAETAPEGSRSSALAA